MPQDHSYETALVNAILGNRPASILMTDGYKFSMAQAGFPLRRETFYMSFRRPGAYFLPFDVEAVVRRLLPRDGVDAMRAAIGGILHRSGYDMTPGMMAAFEMASRPDAVEIVAPPKGSWFREKEPAFAITGPSFIVSNPEPLALMLHFPIQVATEALAGRRDFACTCMDEFHIVKETLLELGLFEGSNITLEADRYRRDVARRAQELIDALEDKNPARLFEVGMRACSCLSMHEVALKELQKLGIERTSNVYLADKLGMIAVGTTGHEHIQRWGDDLDACRAMRDMRPGVPSYLPDTYNVMEQGLPAAFTAIKGRPDRPAVIRFDSGNQDEQLDLCMTEVKAGMPRPTFIFEDSINPPKVQHFEELSHRYEIPLEGRLYGSGQFFVKADFMDITRDRVSAIYKLSMTGGQPTMKVCASAPAKATLPGIPVIFRRDHTVPCEPQHRTCTDLIGQFGETPPAGFVPVQAGKTLPFDGDIGLSDGTVALFSQFSPA